LKRKIKAECKSDIYWDDLVIKRVFFLKGKTYEFVWNKKESLYKVTDEEGSEHFVTEYYLNKNFIII